MFEIFNKSRDQIYINAAFLHYNYSTWIRTYYCSLWPQAENTKTADNWSLLYIMIKFAVTSLLNMINRLEKYIVYSHSNILISFKHYFKTTSTEIIAHTHTHTQLIHMLDIKTYLCI